MKADRDLLLEVASLFYKQGLSQQEIAKKLFFSPSKVSRLMRQAVEAGVVEININYPNRRVADYELLIQRHFGLKEVRVLQTIELSPDSSLHNFGEFSAVYVKEQLRDNFTIGISSGSTVRAAINSIHIHGRKNIEILQLKGMANQENKLMDDVPVLVRMLSEQIDGSQYQLLYSPLYIENSIARASLIQEKIIRQTMDKYDKLDIILTSVSYFSKTEKSAWASYISDEEYNELFYKGTKTCFLGHFIDESGLTVSKDREAKQVGISLDQIRNCRNTILLALGKRKAEAVASALNTQCINSLIIDSQLAEALIENEKIQFIKR